MGTLASYTNVASRIMIEKNSEEGSAGLVAGQDSEQEKWERAGGKEGLGELTRNPGFIPHP